jgi:Rad3-related DNA helicase
LVANHALLLNWPRAYSRPDIVIVDEAHDLVDTATDAFGKEVSLAGIRNVLMRLDGDDSATGVRAMMRRAEALWAEAHVAEVEQGLFREAVSNRLEDLMAESSELLLQLLPLQSLPGPQRWLHRILLLLHRSLWLSYNR